MYIKKTLLDATRTLSDTSRHHWDSIQTLLDVAKIGFHIIQALFIQTLCDAIHTLFVKDRLLQLALEPCLMTGDSCLAGAMAGAWAEARCFP